MNYNVMLKRLVVYLYALNQVVPRAIRITPLFLLTIIGVIFAESSAARNVDVSVNLNKKQAIVDKQIYITKEEVVKGDAKLKTSLQQNKKEITGVVREAATGESVPFCNVLVKGQTMGVITDIEGKFSIRLEKDAILIFASMGFKDVEVSTKGKNEFVIYLEEASVSLDEVVVTGYNTIERKHLASAISTLDVGEIKAKPMTSMEEAFSGTVAGVTLLQSSNLPGSSAGDIRIRGIATLQNSSPLVLIDGLEQSFSDIDPNQIKSMSILKDAASTAIYGSRGANGVIVIETMRGSSGNFTVNVNAWYAIQQPIDLPDFVDAATYMRLSNEARGMQDQDLLYDEVDINNDVNTDWLGEVMQRTASTSNASVNISGGGGVGTFNLMLNYLGQNGLNDKEGMDRFSARFNTNINIMDKFIILADFYAHRVEFDRLKANDNGDGLYQNAWKMTPNNPIYYEGTDIPDHYILYNDINPIASIKEGGIYNSISDRSTINLRPKYYFSPKFHMEANLSYMINKNANKSERATHKFFDGDGKPVKTWGHEVNANQGVSESQLTGRLLLNYESDFRQDKDKIYVLLGAETMSHTYTDYKETTQASFFGKVNYSFDNRYLFEASLRQDGSSKFAPEKRWGLFPSTSLAWNIHNEKFMSFVTTKGFLNELKIRGSWGKIGNNNVDPYLWEESVNYWGWTMRVPNPDLSWEKQTQLNLGIDLGIFNNRLRIVYDNYVKTSTDLIFGKFPVPPLTGSYYLETAVNIGEVENRGWEFSVNWQDKIGDFSYSIGGMLFNNENEVLKAGYKDDDILVFKDNTDKIWYRGVSVNNYYGLQSDGFYKDQAEVDATKAKFANTLPGDIKYVDQDGNGILNDDDKVILGDPDPHYNYAINLTMNYKRFDFKMLGQGVGQRTGHLSGMNGYPVLMDGGTNSMGAPRQEYADNRWTEDTPNSRFPRVWTGASPNARLSDVWLSEAAYFRVKTLQLGYTIPRIGGFLRNLRVYVNAQDAITFTKFEGLEPEDNGGSGKYPRMATYSFGLSATIF